MHQSLCGRGNAERIGPPKPIAIAVLARFQHRVVDGEGVADRRICHGHTKLARHSRAMTRVEQGPHRRSDEAAQAETRLGDQGQA